MGGDRNSNARKKLGVLAVQNPFNCFNTHNAEEAWEGLLMARELWHTSFPGLFGCTASAAKLEAPVIKLMDHAIMIFGWKVPTINVVEQLLGISLVLV